MVKIKWHFACYIRCNKTTFKNLGGYGTRQYNKQVLLYVNDTMNVKTTKKSPFRKFFNPWSSQEFFLHPVRPTQWESLFYITKECFVIMLI